MPAVGYIIAKNTQKKFDSQIQIKDQIVVFIVGILFAMGLMISGMSRRQNILQFLQINENWNPALLFVLTFGLLVNVFVFSYMRKKKYCLMGN